MYNEAFWFFYLVSVMSGIVTVFSICAAALTLATVVTGVMWIHDESHGKWPIWSFVAAMIFTTSAVLVPPERAFYAGAGQYVAQAAEVDQTLLSLKELIDQKILEQIEEPQE